MAYTVHEAKAAEEDVLAIVDYLAGDLDNKQAAERWLTEYVGITDKLRDHPHMFEFSRAPGHRQRGLRKFLIGRYVALYTVDETKKQVLIHRIFHGTQDYQKYL